MEHARKMVVVPHELFERMQSQPVQRKTEKQSYKSLDQQMEDIIGDKTIDDSEKWKLYNQVLQRFLNESSARRQPIVMPIIDTDYNYSEDNKVGVSRQRVTAGQIEEIVETFSKAYKKDARNLLRFLARDGSAITWNENLEVSIDNGIPIPNSNMVDIAHAVVRVRTTNPLPPGWEEVINALRRMNVPKEYIRNKRALDELMNIVEHPGAAEDTDAQSSAGEERGQEEGRRRKSTPDRLQSAYMRRVGRAPYPQQLREDHRQNRYDILADTIQESFNDWEDYKG